MELINIEEEGNNKKVIISMNRSSEENNKKELLLLAADNDGEEEEEEGNLLPGFRFHPTDEELVGFYLRRKVEKKPIRMDLIKQIDIYKYDPWDLPKLEGSIGQKNSKEWYFFCKRGRKYKNSIRPNRVTGSGFWKATGIDKPINHSSSSSHPNSNYNNNNINECININIIGLKKSLVYYQGTAAKASKTDWMMHEFRLPTITYHPNNPNPSIHLQQQQEAEVWTLCRIFKRTPSCKKYTPTLEDTTIATPTTTTATTSTATKANILQSTYNSTNSISNTCSLESDNSKPYLTTSLRSSESSFKSHHQNYVIDQRKPHFGDEMSILLFQGHLAHHHHHHHQVPSLPSMVANNNYNIPSFLNHQTVEDVFANHGNNWDDLTSVVHQFDFDPFTTSYDCINR